MSEAALGREQSPLVKASSCLLEIQKNEDGGKVFCSSNHIGNGFFKTAAHCFANAELITLSCDGQSYRFTLDDLWVHPEFSVDRRGFKSGERQFDLAVINTRGKFTHLLSAKIPQSWQETRNIIARSHSCFFSGYGVNEEHLQLGFYKETQAPPQGLHINQNFLVYESFLKFTVMIGDSGGSLYCNKDNQLFDIGTSSGKDFAQRSLLIASYRLLQFYPELNKVVGIDIASIDEVHLNLEIEIGRTYLVRPFSIFHSLEVEGTQWGNVDNQRVQFFVQSIVGEYALGYYLNSGVSNFYLCADGVICNESNSAKIALIDLEN